MKDNKQLSDYWLEDDDYELSNLYTLLKLQGAVTNFVKIISGRDIPVEFQYGNEKSSLKRIIIPAKLTNIDATVGVAIHETMALLYTKKWCMSRFIDLLNDNYLSEHTGYPELITSAARYKFKGIIRGELELIFQMLEYWRLDDLAIQLSPGYKGYITTAYKEVLRPEDTLADIEVLFKIETNNHRHFHFKRRALFFVFFSLIQSSKHFSGSIKGYLPSWITNDVYYLKLIQLVDINNLSRLKSTEDTVELSICIWEWINRYAAETYQIDYLLFAVKDDDSPMDAYTEKVFTRSEELADSISRALAQENPKESISDEERKKLKLLSARNSSADYTTTYKGRKVKTVVIEHFTHNLLATKDLDFLDVANTYETEKTIVAGIRLGKQLARRIAFRNNSRSTHYTRLTKGNLDGRLLHTLAYGNEKIFCENRNESFPSMNFHISIDGSYSMGQSCFLQSIKNAVALAKVGQLTHNLDIVISFRYHTKVNNNNCPLLLIAYDSRVDNFSKITQLFKYLKAAGPTAEGLCYNAIASQIEKRRLPGEVSYFINLFDGMPTFLLDEDCVYEGQPAFDHTRIEVQRMRKKKIRVLSYFIVEKKWVTDNFKNIEYMYGNDARKINMNDLSELARTINEMIRKGE
ncbi:hypothetical protein [Bacteroides sp. 519]|uniref:hypothetical protein n=1 Tax=Bacteroides sp. 519 TaxID=2302937 RepID=UPI0013D79BCD|nr:hypothetical protein [Bacteroides sp. 519]NDV60137.1 hypothetical protein [Bacteroides sp. 519]